MLGRGPPVVVAGPTLVELPPPTGHRTAHRVYVRRHIRAHQLPADHGQRQEPQPQSAKHESVGEPDRLGVRQIVHRDLHRAIDVFVASRKDQHEADQRDRKEGDGGLGKADDQP